MTWTPRAAAGPRAAAVLAAAALTAGALAGCAGDPAGADRPQPGDGAVGGEVVVLAAASLTEAFAQVARDVEEANPGLDVTLSSGGSAALAQQVVSGAPADVLATASPQTMAVVVDAGAAAVEPTAFATNRLQVAVPPGNPGGVTGLADLAEETLAVALCAEQVPCGAVARTAFAEAGLEPAPDTLERDVRAVLAKVRLGEVDAGVVYRSDVVAAGDGVEVVDAPELAAAITDYHLVALAAAPNAAGARVFTEAVRSDRGRHVLSDAGFGPAPGDS